MEAGAAAPAFSRFKVGTAGWSIPKTQARFYPAIGSHLARYAGGLRCVEINSSFYRHHQAKTYARWADSVGDDFRFSVKLARAFTHDSRLTAAPQEVKACLADVAELKEKFGALLVQLPPKLAFDEEVVSDFLSYLVDHCPAPIAWEPRHPSWTQPDALALLERYGVCKVIADPERCPAPLGPRADRSLRYYRLHGSPEMYRSRYEPAYLEKLSREMQSARSASVWCIFDNTTFGFAHDNAHELNALLAKQERAAG